MLHLALELGWSDWKLAFTIGQGQAARLRSIQARNLESLQTEIAKAKRRFGIPEDAEVRSCYETGRDGFWLHRHLTSVGIQNVIVDSASIEVKRRARRAKSDRLDAAKLVSMLMRYHGGERKVWSVVTAPSDATEDQRQLHRELIKLKDERTEHSNRIKGLLAAQGLALATVDDQVPARLAELRRWDGSASPTELQARLLREHERWRQVAQQIKDLEHERRKRIRRDSSAHVDQVRQLLEVCGVGLNGAWPAS